MPMTKLELKARMDWYENVIQSTLKDASDLIEPVLPTPEIDEINKLSEELKDALLKRYGPRGVFLIAGNLLATYMCAESVGSLGAMTADGAHILVCVVAPSKNHPEILT